MPRRRTYRAVDPAFLDSAPVRGTTRRRLPVDAATAFRCLEDPDAWPRWLDAIDEVVWTSPEPKGAGTTRDIKGKIGHISEYFFAWEDGRRMAFCFDQGTSPAFAAFAEDYVLEPLDQDSCELVWRWAAELAGPLRLLHRVAPRALGRGFDRAAGALAEHLAADGARYAAPAG